ncbi:MAG: ribulose 1,5-bisphosphate carboxylase large subunit [Deltaproteobacteria bacterium]|nr:ribulose 1,5-bisphosphate carboxylase large subunit [Deltaproteobacteria bacterium]
MYQTPRLALEGERFTAAYQIRGTRRRALETAREICIEQTVEYPDELIRRPDIREQIIGDVTRFEALDDQTFQAEIAFPIEVAGEELPQLLNVLFGNISLKPEIRLVGIDLPRALSRFFRGPRYGRNGLRERVRVPARPLLATALKPMGLSPQELAQLAYQFALSGIDMIKDDHGLANQVFSTFDERVARCSDAVNRANRETGLSCIYLPNITSRADQVMERAETARDSGAGGLLICPGLTGYDTMRAVADDDSIALPILCHPAMQGAFTTHRGSGIAHGVLYGQINRLAGADGAIFPNYGGRFSFSEGECRDLLDGTLRPMGEIKPIFPVPAGGMSLERIPEIVAFYGDDVILLIGGDLHRRGLDLSHSCREFLQMVSRPSSNTI